MDQSKQKTAQLLTYSGAIPFVALTLLSARHEATTSTSLPTEALIHAYGAIIISFICGISWGIYLFKSCPLNLFIISNIIALIAWCSLMLTYTPATIIQLASFLALLKIDHTLFKANVIDPWYFSLRCRITAIVTSTLVAYLAISSLT